MIAEDALRHSLGIAKRDDSDMAQVSRSWQILRARDEQAAWAWLSLGRTSGKDATLRGLFWLLVEFGLWVFALKVNQKLPPKLDPGRLL